MPLKALTDLRLNGTANRCSQDAKQTMSDAFIVNEYKYRFHFTDVNRLLVWVVVGFRVLLKERQGDINIRQTGPRFISVGQFSLTFQQILWCVCVGMASLGSLWNSMSGRNMALGLLEACGSVLVG